MSHAENPQKDQFYLEEMPWQERKEGEEKHTGAKEHVLAFLQENGESSLPDVISALSDSCTESAVRQAVQALEKDGTILRTSLGGPGRRKVAYFVLTCSREMSPRGRK